MLISHGIGLFMTPGTRIRFKKQVDYVGGPLWHNPFILAHIGEEGEIRRVVQGPDFKKGFPHTCTHYHVVNSSHSLWITRPVFAVGIDEIEEIK